MLAPFFLLLAAQSPDVVVTAKSLAAAHDRCTRGGCTSLEDARASIAFAEMQFRDGAYLKARRTLESAVARNRQMAATDPKPLVFIYEALATVARHEGDQAVYRRAVAGRVRTASDHLPPSDIVRVAAAPALGDMWLELGNRMQADAVYQAGEREATAAGQHDAAMILALRRAWLLRTSGQAAKARTLIDAIAARPVAREAFMALLLDVVRLRIAIVDEDEAEIAKLMQAVGRHGRFRPMLLSEPTYELRPQSMAQQIAAPLHIAEPFPLFSNNSSQIQWADIGFWIRPDGSTAEIEVLRTSRGVAWTGVVIGQIAGRRYTAANTDSPEAGAGDVYRVERITRKSSYTTPTDSLIRRRRATGGFVVLDLTDDAGQTTAITPATQPQSAPS